MSSQTLALTLMNKNNWAALFALVAGISIAGGGKDIALMDTRGRWITLKSGIFSTERWITLRLL